MQRFPASDGDKRNARDQREQSGEHPASPHADRDKRPRAADAPKISARSVLTWTMATLLVASLLLVGFFVISSLKSTAKSGHGGGDVGVGAPPRQ